ncbi:MAG: hypothetical protein ACP5RD_05490 [bacterium]
MIKTKVSQEQKQNVLHTIKFFLTFCLILDILFFSFFIFFPTERVNLEYSKEVKKALFQFFNNKEIEVSGVKIIITGFSDTLPPDLDLYINSNTRDFNKINFYGVLEFEVKSYKILVASVQLLRERISKNNRTKIIFNASVIKLTNNFNNQYFQTKKPILKFDINKKITEKYLSEILVTSFENIFNITKIEYKSNSELKINENLNNLLDSLERIRKKHYFNHLSLWLSLFTLSFTMILIMFSFIYFQNKKYLESK